MIKQEYYEVMFGMPDDDPDERHRLILTQDGYNVVSDACTSGNGVACVKSLDPETLGINGMVFFKPKESMPFYVRPYVQPPKPVTPEDDKMARAMTELAREQPILS